MLQQHQAGEPQPPGEMRPASGSPVFVIVSTRRRRWRVEFHEVPAEGDGQHRHAYPAEPGGERVRGRPFLSGVVLMGGREAWSAIVGTGAGGVVCCAGCGLRLNQILHTWELIQIYRHNS